MARLLPDFRTVIDRTAPDRDRSIDVARLGALLVVMFGHCALLLATITAAGVQIGNTLGAVPSLQPATWVLQVMPLFFFAGGAAGIHSWRDGTPWGTWLFTRAQRLCRPALWYLGAWTAALIVVRFTMGAESAAALGNEAVALLWFLGTYLIVLAFVPALAQLRSGRSAALVVAALLAVAALGDWARISTHTLAAGAANLIVVWLIPMVIGAVYAHRFAAPRTALIVAAGTLAVQVALAKFGPYDVSLVVTGNERMSNVTPPTLLLALQCIWMPSLFIACTGAVRRWAQRPRVWYLIVVGNSGAMTLYLWHIVAIAIATFGLHAAGLDAYDPAAPYFWRNIAIRALVFAVVMTAMFLLLSPLEHNPLWWWDARVRATGRASTLAGVLVCAAGAALLLMAKYGLGTGSGWMLLALFTATLVGARISAGRPAARHEAAENGSAPGLSAR
ncbi:acyltransferase family protein [Mycolicibacterium aubagnense]|uniref:Acetyltransferase n=1 Tax=Mycolicibacterium aubagnense TaxID=319707 RepID=A0ABM7IJW8_9MYCO|nr:acyltransferase [Mycolicibacterium aubagnense]TLH66285.1 acetyltransferase [Mycolicibacterium aubagnense]WGI31463.1 acyltransferase [Mycolicibacterium aubagnense]BBX87092.1 acetyltransferase [Mycolicibacterium aubagnense]